MGDVGGHRAARLTARPAVLVLIPPGAGQVVQRMVVREHLRAEREAGQPGEDGLLPLLERLARKPVQPVHDVAAAARFGDEAQLAADAVLFDNVAEIGQEFIRDKGGVRAAVLREAAGMFAVDVHQSGMVVDVQGDRSFHEIHSVSMIGCK